MSYRNQQIVSQTKQSSAGVVSEVNEGVAEAVPLVMDMLTLSPATLGPAFPLVATIFGFVPSSACIKSLPAFGVDAPI